MGRDAIDAAISEPLVLLLFERGAHVLNAPPRLGVDPVGERRCLNPVHTPHTRQHSHPL